MAHLKNRSDLEEFPDGGRATLVRRYSPALTRRQLTILRACPYDAPAQVADALRQARVLVRYGLLEENPTAHVFRVTAAGADVVARWAAAGLLP